MTTYHLVGYTTLQLHWGGLLVERSHDGLVHLVRRASDGGTPGPTLCGIDRFAKNAPGFSVGGGWDHINQPCHRCNDNRHPGIPLDGLNAHIFEAVPA